jgi:FkbM family methyltransferase
LNDPRVIVEAGASDGVDTLKFARIFPKATIFAVEPVEKQYDFLTNKFKNYTNIHLFQVALSKNIELANIFIGNTNSDLGGMGSSSILRPTLHKKYFPEITFNNSSLVQTITLEKFFLENQIESVDLLWLDIQGMEFDVIQASQDTMRKCVRFLHLEISRIKFYAGMPSEKDLRKLLKLIGFKCVIDRVGAISGNALYVNRQLSSLN